MKHIRAIWAYRYFIFSSIKTEFYARFVRSRLGGLWLILHPLAQVAIYALILSQVLASKLPGIESPYAYAIYLMAGMLAWTLFAEVLSRSLNIFIDNANLIKKIAFPKIALPFIIAGSALLNNLLLFVAILVVFGLLGHVPSIQLLWIPFLIMLTLGLGLGFGLMLGIINVFIRDMGQIVPIILQFWFWLTPIVYVSSLIPQKYQALLLINPMSSIAMAYQQVLIYGKIPNLGSLIYPCILTMGLLFLALIMYIRANEEMADVL